MPLQSKPEISVVVPVFNEQDMIPKFLEELSPVMQTLGSTYEIVFVDDGSGDDTWLEICRLAKSVEEVRGIKLTKNYGKEIALFAGLESAEGRAHIPMDVDLQDPPSLIPTMIGEWKLGSTHVVPYRESRSDHPLRNRISKLFHRVGGIQDVHHGGLDVGDFRLLDEAVTSRFLQYRDTRRYNKAIFREISARPRYIGFSRPKSSRSGKPSQSLAKLFDLAQTALLQDSKSRIRSLVIGFSATTTLFLLLIVLAALLWAIGIIEVPGQATVIVLFLLSYSIQFILFGVLALFLSEILEEGRSRPLFLVEAET